MLIYKRCILLVYNVNYITMHGAKKHKKQKTHNFPLTARLTNTTLPVSAVSRRKALCANTEDHKITTGL
jgi:hypothetical protein